MEKSEKKHDFWVRLGLIDDLKIHVTNPGIVSHPRDPALKLISGYVQWPAHSTNTGCSKVE